MKIIQNVILDLLDIETNQLFMQYYILVYFVFGN